MVNITNEQWQVLINILGAVETGNQIYGQRDYSDYTEAYANSSAETALTIGAFQEFQDLAKGLLQDIKNQYPDVFAKYDNAGIATDLTRNSWYGYSPSKTSAKAKAIVAIISTNEGKKVQDDRFIKQMKEHVAYGEKKGVTDVGGLFEVCNIAHQGGYGAVDRILAKTAKPYTADNIYNALCTDTGTNQVGTYKTRQSKVYQWLKQYMPTTSPQPTTATQTTYEITPGTTAEEILNIMRGWIGLNEQDGSYMKILNLYNSHRPLARGYAIQPNDEWCDCTISALFIKANAVNLIGGTEVGVEEHVKLFIKAGIWNEDGATTDVKPGDIIVFSWSKSVQPNNNYSSHIGIVEYVENGIIHTIEGNANEMVRRRTYEIGNGNIRGFARPRYDVSSIVVVEEPFIEEESAIVEEEAVINPDTTGSFTLPLRKNNVGSAVRNMQLMLIALGYDCGSYGADGDFGPDTEASVKLFQKQHGLKQTGIFSIEEKIQLEKSYNNLRASDVYPHEMFAIKSPKTIVRKSHAKNKPIIAEIPIGEKMTAIKSKINKAGKEWIYVKQDSISGWVVATSLRY